MTREPLTDMHAGEETTALSADTMESPALSEYPADQVERTLYEIQSEQNLVSGAIAGMVAGATGALLWAAVTVATSFQIGWLAIGIGFLVGTAVRWAGRGTTQTFGIVGGTLALISVLAGNFLSLLGLTAGDLGISYLEIVTQFDYSQTLNWMAATFSPIDLLFYAIAIWQAYQVSTREISTEEIRQRLVAEGVARSPNRSL